MGSEAVAALFDELESVAGRARRAALLIDDIEEMRDYFATYFRTNTLLAELGSAYWARAATVIPRLRPAQRARRLCTAVEQHARLDHCRGPVDGGAGRLGFTRKPRSARWMH